MTTPQQARSSVPSHRLAGQPIRQLHPQNDLPSPLVLFGARCLGRAVDPLERRHTLPRSGLSQEDTWH